VPANAIRIDTAGVATGIVLPEDDAAELYVSLRGLLGGTPEGAVYHHRALLWAHGDGQNEGLEPNLVAWTLASAWRDMALPYQLYGTVITGREYGGGSAPLDDDLAGQVHAVAKTVSETMALLATAAAGVGGRGNRRAAGLRRPRHHNLTSSAGYGRATGQVGAVPRSLGDC
jgi:hypothetical protein